ncbi:allantoinase AllB [Geomicrobium sediminis]|uniref:Allantoinase n=1 Tax=Geomicrobium sediminis TaxID=1347788 RepID=A0ABS2P9G0_9BACL|nr:allantoinase [Geomicrobium sediminis]
MYDLIIKNGVVVLPHEVKNVDIGIQDGKIVALSPSLQVASSPVYNAENCYVLPGVIDAHVHLNEPGRDHWEGFTTGSQMLAAGGCTTYFDMPLNSIPATVNENAFHEKKKIGSEKSINDFRLWGGLVPGNLSELASLHNLGVIGFKAFLSPSGTKEFNHTDDQTLLEGMREIARLGSVLALHAESTPIIEHLERNVNIEDQVQAYSHMRPIIAESEAVKRSLSFAELTGCALHFVHISNTSTLQLIQEAKQQGLDVTVETCPHYLLFNDQAMYEQGVHAKCAPPLRNEEHRERLVQALVNGQIDFVASDHSPSPNTLKQTGNFFTAWGGINGGQFTLLSLLELTETTSLTIQDVAQLTATAPASRFKLTRDRGSIEEGKLADLVVVNKNEYDAVTEETLHSKHKDSLYLGHRFPHRIKETFYRGQSIYKTNRP